MFVSGSRDQNDFEQIMVEISQHLRNGGDYRLVN